MFEKNYKIYENNGCFNIFDKNSDLKKIKLSKNLESKFN